MEILLAKSRVWEILYKYKQPGFFNINKKWRDRDKERKSGFLFNLDFPVSPSLISYDPFLVIFTMPSPLSSIKSLQFSSFLFFLFLCLEMPKFENHCSWWEGPSKSFMRFVLCVCVRYPSVHYLPIAHRLHHYLPSQ